MEHFMYVRWNNGGFNMLVMIFCRSLWPRDLKAWVCSRLFAGIVDSSPAGRWRFVCCDCCVLSGRGLCVEPITRPEESYGVWCVLLSVIMSPR